MGLAFVREANKPAGLRGGQWEERDGRGDSDYG